METPIIQFSEWYSWKDVRSIPNGGRSGIYIVAHFEQKPDGIADPKDKEILYIGETHGKSQSISKRLQKFFKASQIGEMIYKHSGGNRFYDKFQGDLTSIYAACYAPNLEPPYLTAFIHHVERQLIWDYLIKWHQLPICNKK